MADISDILASVSRPSHLDTLPHSSSQDEQALAQSDQCQLTRAFISERTSPELLPYPSSLMERMTGRIRAQISRIEDMTASMQTGSSFSLVVLQTDLERTKWLMRSFLRARLSKIDKHTPFLLSAISSSNNNSQSQTQSQSQSQNTPAGITLHTDTEPLMSPTEQAYATRHNTLLEHHYARTFLSAFPPKLQRLDDKVGGGGGGGAAMVQGPDLESVVFVRCLGIPRGRAGTNNNKRRGFMNGNSNSNRNGLDDDDEDDNRVIHEDDDDELQNGFGPVTVSCGYTPDPNDTNARRDFDMAGSSSQQQQQQNQQQSRWARVTGERMVTMRRGEIWAVRWSSVREAVARGQVELV